MSVDMYSRVVDEDGFYGLTVDGIFSTNRSSEDPSEETLCCGQMFSFREDHNETCQDAMTWTAREYTEEELDLFVTTWGEPGWYIDKTIRMRGQVYDDMMEELG
jgi:hypothetical protein